MGALLIGAGGTSARTGDAADVAALFWSVAGACLLSLIFLLRMEERVLRSDREPA